MSIACSYSTGGRNRDLRDWLGRLDRAAIDGEPALAFGAAVERLAAGDRDAAEQLADVAESAAGAAPGASLRAGLATIRAGLARGGARDMLAHAQRAAELAGTGEWRPSACLIGGVAQRLLGDPEVARERLAVAARRSGAETSTVRVLALAMLAQLELERDDPDVAHALVESALHDAAAIGFADEPACALVHAIAARARARAGRVEQARADIDCGRRLLAALPDPAPWYAAETSIALACALLRLSDSPEARELLGTAGRTVRSLPDAAGLRETLDAAWERADSFAIDSVVGPSALTIAELRVLRFLPSHLSFREIAERLHVSANTVKTQAHAVYRKLDASSRSEAVARAVTIGLVDS